MAKDGRMLSDMARVLEDAPEEIDLQMLDHPLAVGPLPVDDPAMGRPRSSTLTQTAEMCAALSAFAFALACSVGRRFPEWEAEKVSEVCAILQQPLNVAENAAWPEELPNDEEDRLVAALVSGVARDSRAGIVRTLTRHFASQATYDARARVALRHFCRMFSVDATVFRNEEALVAKGRSADADHFLNPDAEDEEIASSAATSRAFKVGAAAMAGGAVLFLTGGLLAPVLGAVAAGALTAAGASGAAGVATVAVPVATKVALTGIGASVVGRNEARHTAALDTFALVRVHGGDEEASGGMLIGVSGWLGPGYENYPVAKLTAAPAESAGEQAEAGSSEDETPAPARPGRSASYARTADDLVLDPWGFAREWLDVFDATLEDERVEYGGDNYALVWEPQELRNLGSAMAGKQTWSGMLSSPFNAVGGAMALSTDPFRITLDRADKAGVLLAVHLTSRGEGARPVRLVGYSVGARVVFSCLVELERLQAYGVVEDAFLLCAPVSSSETAWTTVRSVVARRLVNAFLPGDRVLSASFRPANASLSFAGLCPVNIVCVEDINLTEVELPACGVEYEDMLEPNYDDLLDGSSDDSATRIQQPRRVSTHADLKAMLPSIVSAIGIRTL